MTNQLLLRRATNVPLAILMVLALGSVAACSEKPGDSDLWLEDFDKLKLELATGYANLEWSALHNGFELADLSRETANKLRSAGSRREARKIISTFLESFDDPHLRAEHADPPADTPSSGGQWLGPRGTDSAKKALKVFGYHKAKYDFGVDFKSFDGFTELQDNGNPFPTGVLQMDDGRKLGVIRIKYFGEDRYYDVAADTWEEFRSGVEDTCDEDCWWPFTYHVRLNLMEYLEARLEELQGVGVNAILVDITGNGGGSEWCEDVAQLFTKKKLRPAGTGFVKHEHLVKQIEQEIAWIEEDLQQEDLSIALREMLESEMVAHADLLDAVGAGCPELRVWQKSSTGSDCDRIAYDEHGKYDVPEGDEAVAALLQSEHILFQPSRHPSFVSLYEGPLFVAIDGRTASASEQFATLLQFNNAATIVGETSYGAGCGYTNGGIKLYLEHVQLRVRMPDCVRLRADGENELAGVDPDLLGWDEGDKGKTRARKLVEVLRTGARW